MTFWSLLGMKAYSKDLRLKVLDAVDHGMARQEVAHTREALDEAIPDALSSVKLEDVAGWFSHFAATDHRINTHGKRCQIRSAEEPAMRNPRRVTPLDPSLTLTRTQYPAIPSNRGNEKPLIYAGFANPCDVQQPLTAHS